MKTSDSSEIGRNWGSDGRPEVTKFVKKVKFGGVTISNISTRRALTNGSEVHEILESVFSRQ
jgi:hypothetical protein